MKKNIGKWEKDKQRNAEDPKRGIRGGHPKGKDPTAQPTHPSTLPKGQKVTNLRVDGDLDLSLFDDLEPDQAFVVNPPDVEEGEILQAVAPLIPGDPPRWDRTTAAVIAVTTDLAAPSSNPATPTLTGGQRWIAVNWDGVTNADPLKYNVYVGTTAGFTADATTLAGSIAGTLMFVRTINGSPLVYDQDYYVQVYAADEDGQSVAAVHEAGPEQLDPNARDDITAGEVIAEHLEAVMTISNKFVAGDILSAHGEFDQYGLRAYLTDAITQSFNVDFQTGDVGIYGNLDFGASRNDPSRLTSGDYIEFADVTESGYETPLRVQTNSVHSDSPTASAIYFPWSGATTTGNHLVLHVEVWQPSGTTPTVTTPSGWSLAESITNGQLRSYVFYKENAATQSSVTVSLSGAMTAGLLRAAGAEFNGVAISSSLDIHISASGSSTAMNTGTSGSTAQAYELILGFFSYVGNTGSTVPATYSRFNYFGNSDATAFGANKSVTATGSQSAASTLTTSAVWSAILVTFKARAANSTVAAPALQKGRMYAKTVNPHAALQGGITANNDTKPYWKDDWGQDNLMGVPRGSIHLFAGRFAPIGYVLCDGSSYLYGDDNYQPLGETIMPYLGTFTVTIATPAVFSKTAHGLEQNDQVVLFTSGGGALPTGLTVGTVYYVSATGLTADAFQLSATVGGASINTTGSQSGTHSIYYCPWGWDNATQKFYVPDLRGKVPVGLGTTSVYSYLANTFGAATFTMTTTYMPTHSHIINASGTHTHTAGTLVNSNNGSIAFRYKQTMQTASNQDVITSLSGEPASAGTQANGVPSHTHNISGSTAAGGDHDHGGATQDSGSGTPFNLYQPSVVVQYIIKL